MKCDLCGHRELHSKNKLLCESCAEMVQRLLVVQQRIDSMTPSKVEVADAQPYSYSAWGQR
jgi:hypothetical protein